MSVHSLGRLARQRWWAEASIIGRRVKQDVFPDLSAAIDAIPYRKTHFVLQECARRMVTGRGLRVRR